MGSGGGPARLLSSKFNSAHSEGLIISGDGCQSVSSMRRKGKGTDICGRKAHW